MTSWVRTWPWIVGLLLVFVFGFVVGAVSATLPGDPRGASAAPATTDPAIAPAVPATLVIPGPKVTVGEGKYQVGVDVVAGRYKTPGPIADDALPMCTWSRNKDDSGSVESVIAGNVTQGPAVVTIRSGEFFELHGSCVWTRV